ncbi:MAG: restriction endonuclease [Gemmatimonadetes bacterium]|nr:restriction endonuclease [Gemmatimonadota bacterium]
MALREDAVLKLTDKGMGLRAQQVVGILAVPGITVEILPKVDGEDGAVRAALVQMLAVARGIRPTSGDLAAMETQRHDLLELLIQLFADRLLATVRRGLPRRYVRHDEDLGVLRGALNVKRQFTALLTRPDLVACRFDELSEDTPLNRVFKAAATRLAGLTRSWGNHRRLMELLARLDNVADSASPLKEPVALDRTNVAFHDLHRLAMLFLRGDWQQTATGRASGFSLLFPMNDLFEEFVGRSLQKALGVDRVRLQHQRRALNSPHYLLRPDMVVDVDGQPVVVLDTKWKRLGDGPKREDVNQMLVYGQAYGAERVILVYPWHEAVGEKGTHRRWTVTGPGYDFETATVDVGHPAQVPQSLRGLFE